MSPSLSDIFSLHLQIFRNTEIALRHSSAREIPLLKLEEIKEC